MLSSMAGAEELKLPAKTESIGEEAFMNCGFLDEVILPEGLLSIESRAFANSSVRLIYLPSSITDIADDAFEGCITTGWGPEGTYAGAFFDEKENLTFSGKKPYYPDIPQSLIDAALEEGKVELFGASDLMFTAAERFEDIFGIETEITIVSASDMTTMLNLRTASGSPAGDVWFAAPSARCGMYAEYGVLDSSYTPVHAAHLLKSGYRDGAGYWYGLYADIPGFAVNKDMLAEMELEVPKTWDDLLKEEYRSLIQIPDYQRDFGKKLVNTILQMKGHDEGILYLAKLLLQSPTLQTAAYSSGMITTAANGGSPIALCYLQMAVQEIEKNGYENLQLVVPEDGTSWDLQTTALFGGALSAGHPNAARLFLEFALSPDCADLSFEEGLYLFPVMDNADWGGHLAAYGLDLSHVSDKYDPGKDLPNDEYSKCIEEIWATIEELW